MMAAEEFSHLIDLMPALRGRVDAFEGTSEVSKCAERCARGQSDPDAMQATGNDLDRRTSVIGDDQRLCVAVLQNVGRLGRREMPIDGGIDEAEPLRGPARREVVLAIRHHDADMVAMADAIRTQVASKLARTIVQLAVGERRAGAAHDDSRTVWDLLRIDSDVIGSWLIRHRALQILLRLIDQKYAFKHGPVLSRGLHVDDQPPVAAKASSVPCLRSKSAMSRYSRHRLMRPAASSSKIATN